jgi:hypothetical protein
MVLCYECAAPQVEQQQLGMGCLHLVSTSLTDAVNQQMISSSSWALTFYLWPYCCLSNNTCCSFVRSYGYLLLLLRRIYMKGCKSCTTLLNSSTSAAYVAEQSGDQG